MRDYAVEGAPVVLLCAVCNDITYDVRRIDKDVMPERQIGSEGFRLERRKKSKCRMTGTHKDAMNCLWLVDLACVQAALGFIQNSYDVWVEWSDGVDLKVPVGYAASEDDLREPENDQIGH